MNVLKVYVKMHNGWKKMQAWVHNGNFMDVHVSLEKTIAQD
jgi:hypothetical protein